MFRTVFPFIIRSSRLYIQLSNRYCCLLSRKQRAMSVWQMLASNQRAVSVWQMSVAVCTIFNCWWWTERPPETCRVSFQNKINLIHSASSWFYYRNNITMHGPMNVKISFVIVFGPRKIILKVNSMQKPFAGVSYMHARHWSCQFLHA